MDSTYPQRRAAHVEVTGQALAAVFGRQRADVMTSGAFNPDDWNPRLTQVVFSRNKVVAAEFATLVARRLDGEVDADLLDPWLTQNAQVTAAGINDSVADRVKRALDDSNPLFALGELFTTLAAVTSHTYAQQMVTTAANFGAQDGARAAGARSKTWKTNSGRPRSIHAALDGETVGFDETFSNGMAWPGDPSGGPENNANCLCSVEFN